MRYEYINFRFEGLIYYLLLSLLICSYSILFSSHFNSSVSLKISAIVVTPSKETCEALGITRKGHPQKEIIDYLGNHLESEYAYFAKYLKKRNLFAKVDSVIVDFPKVYSQKVQSKYDAVIYLHQVSPGNAGWYLLVGSNNQPKSIYMDPIADTGHKRVESWLSNIENITKENGYAE